MSGEVKNVRSLQQQLTTGKYLLINLEGSGLRAIVVTSTMYTAAALAVLVLLAQSHTSSVSIYRGNLGWQFTLLYRTCGTTANAIYTFRELMDLTNIDTSYERVAPQINRQFGFHPSFEEYTQLANNTLEPFSGGDYHYFFVDLISEGSTLVSSDVPNVFSRAPQSVSRYILSAFDHCIQPEVVATAQSSIPKLSTAMTFRFIYTTSKQEESWLHFLHKLTLITEQTILACTGLTVTVEAWNKIADTANSVYSAAVQKDPCLLCPSCGCLDSQCSINVNFTIWCKLTLECMSFSRGRRLTSMRCLLPFDLWCSWLHIGSTDIEKRFQIFPSLLDLLEFLRLGFGAGMMNESAICGADVADVCKLWMVGSGSRRNVAVVTKIVQQTLTYLGAAVFHSDRHVQVTIPLELSRHHVNNLRRRAFVFCLALEDLIKTLVTGVNMNEEHRTEYQLWILSWLAQALFGRNGGCKHMVCISGERNTMKSTLITTVFTMLAVKKVLKLQLTDLFSGRNNYCTISPSDMKALVDNEIQMILFDDEQPDKALAKAHTQSLKKICGQPDGATLTINPKHQDTRSIQLTHVSMVANSNRDTFADEGKRIAFCKPTAPFPISKDVEAYITPERRAMDPYLLLSAMRRCDCRKNLADQPFDPTPWNTVVPVDPLSTCSPVLLYVLLSSIPVEEMAAFAGLCRAYLLTHSVALTKCRPPESMRIRARDQPYYEACGSNEELDQLLLERTRSIHLKNSHDVLRQLRTCVPMKIVRMSQYKGSLDFPVFGLKDCADLYFICLPLVCPMTDVNHAVAMTYGSFVTSFMPTQSLCWEHPLVV